VSLLLILQNCILIALIHLITYNLIHMETYDKSAPMPYESPKMEVIEIDIENTILGSNLDLNRRDGVW
jgi:hypothetical protein